MVSRAASLALAVRGVPFRPGDPLSSRQGAGAFPKSLRPAPFQAARFLVS